MRFIAVGIVVALAGGASAELPSSLSPRALTPSRMRVSANESVELRIASPDAPAPRQTRWPESEIAWFFHRADGKQSNRDTLAPATPGGDHAPLALPDAGVSMIGVQFPPLVVTLNAEQFDDLQKRNREESDDAPPAKPAVAARVRHQSCAAALILVSIPTGQSDEPSAVATSKSGQKAEIRAMLDPTRCKPGDELPVRVYADGDKAAGARVRAIGPDGKVTATTTNPSAFATIPITAAGSWRIEFQHLAVARDDPGADWVLYSGSLTFEAAAAAVTEQGGTR